MHIYEYCAADKCEIRHLLISFWVTMVTLIAIILALVNYILFETTGQPRCSTAGTAGLAGCECNFLGACDVSGSQNPGLNILNHATRFRTVCTGQVRFLWKKLGIFM